MSNPHYRVVTSSSIFDGHDAAINVFRRLFQKAGFQVIHIGHNRSVEQIVRTALQEDVDGICISSYQGGHMEFFRYLRDCLDQNGASHIKIFGGGGGTILPSEITELQEYGITRLYHAEDGRKMGLRGIIHDALSHVSPHTWKKTHYQSIAENVLKNIPLSDLQIATSLSCIEAPEKHPVGYETLQETMKQLPDQQTPVIGITGPGGAGKSSLIDEIITRFLYSCSEKDMVAVLAFDPTKKKTGGALLGDRIRMNSIYNDRVYVRSMQTGSQKEHNEISSSIEEALAFLKQCGFSLIILETTGIGQADASVVPYSDLSLYVMTSEYGASSQLEKIDMIDYADIIVINKFDKMGAEDALEDVQHALANSRGQKPTPKVLQNLPVFGTIASDFNNPGMTMLYQEIIEKLKEKKIWKGSVDTKKLQNLSNPQSFSIIAPDKTFYLGQIAETIRDYHKKTKEQQVIASKAYHLQSLQDEPSLQPGISELLQKSQKKFDPGIQPLLNQYFENKKALEQEKYCYTVRGKTIHRPLYTESLSDLSIPRIATPNYKDFSEILSFVRKENFPGHFPYTNGVFPLKRDTEDPKRQFAGEGGPKRTNKRFHYLSKNDPAKRLSTAFDSVTLYGEDPAIQPDIYGKIGNSGVSIATLDDMHELYKGFDLTDPLTSVSLTINGPAPMILAMFLNTAIDFAVEKKTGSKREDVDPSTYNQVKEQVLQTVRGTVQADILKEEQAQNTCIFSSKFALKMMGDIQEYFIEKKVRNFYSVSISGYHIAEAGANPITQLALTLSNGFTYLEYYLSRGMPVDKIASNLSFFFSCGLDPEYAVLGRVARRIWAIALREKYGANDQSCRLKYHIQTSGRSLHAQEIAFNDIRTTLQALLAVYDHCNSLHTNAYDEAITTPTEESVRRAMAIQMILTNEFGPAKCDNPMQGAFFIEMLTDLVEEAVLLEFDRISRRGGVLGAMEKQYQRHQIQSESMKYEMMKASGELPIIGVNTFLGPENTNYESLEVIRATEQEKQEQITRCQDFIKRAGSKNQEALERLSLVALSGKNIFAELMETVKYASLGQISHLLYKCGGEYRRSM